MALNIHNDIKNKLKTLKGNKNIPNIIFYGPYGSGKRTLVEEFVSSLYDNNKVAIRSYVLYANCAQGKGIKFIREELKFFSKTHISLNYNNNFKTIVLSNADYLTIDAQSAMRRCIELFSHNTRFFIIVNNKSKLLKPILSRFSEIYIPLPVINSKKINLHIYNINKKLKSKENNNSLKKIIKDIKNPNYNELIILSNKIYEMGYSGKDIIEYIHKNKLLDQVNNAEKVLVFDKIKKDFRNEKLFILFILNFLFIRSNDSLENVSFM